MAVQVSSLYMALLLFPCFICTCRAQENTNFLVPAASEAIYVSSANEHAHIFIYYPIAKSGNALSVFLNKKNIAKLNNGARIECRLLLEGPVAITIIEGNKYEEPLTQSKNSRTISVKKGKSYYFRVSGSGALDYVMNAEKGEKSFAEAKEFISKPGLFVETADSGIPALETVSK